ncbi:hypothetical protein [Vibrio phage vB_ValS_PJ32]|nr:hypothetical protein [Vibrio phage vB_ValS_PJ32]
MLITPRTSSKRQLARITRLANSEKITHQLKLLKKNQLRNTECFCGSGKKLKKCCNQLHESKLRLKLAEYLLESDRRGFM